VEPEGGPAAESDDVRRRVEKVTIAPRTVLIEPFLRWASRNRDAIQSGRVTTLLPAQWFTP
jgi:hypothetical protein